MTYRRIAAFPFVWAALFLAALVAVPVETRIPLYRVGMEASKALAAGGCFAAAFAFERGDYMRRAWTFNACCYLFLLCRDTALAMLPEGAATAAAVGGVLALVANLASVIGTLLLARAWAIAGLEYPGSRAARVSVFLATLAAALAASGTDLVLDARTLLGGDLTSLHSVASDVGDVVSLCMLAPMVLTVVGMSGGVLKWPWGLLTASLVFWLLYDAAATVDHFTAGHEVTTRLAREVFRALACACEFSAGLAQRRVVTASTQEQLAE
jgi:hypothetical protein